MYVPDLDSLYFYNFALFLQDMVLMFCYIFPCSFVFQHEINLQKQRL